MVVLRNTIFIIVLKDLFESLIHLSGGRGELGHSLGALGDSVLGELSREKETHSSLNLSGREGLLLVVARQTRSLQSEAFKDVVDERVEDGDASLGHTSVGVDLLQHLVDVRRVRFHTLGVLLGSGLLGGLGCCFLADCGGFCHFILLVVL
jgi:hypothetical protein